MDKMIKNFLGNEVLYKEAYEEILLFATSENIRFGEYKRNRYVVKKMDLENFFIFPEDAREDNYREIIYCTSIYRDDLVNVINDYASKLGFV